MLTEKILGALKVFWRPSDLRAWVGLGAFIPSGPRAICAIVSDGSFSDRRGLLGSARHPEIDRLTSIVAGTTKKFSARFPLKINSVTF